MLWYAAPSDSDTLVFTRRWPKLDSTQELFQTSAAEEASYYSIVHVYCCHCCSVKSSCPGGCILCITFMLLGEPCELQPMATGNNTSLQGCNTISENPVAFPGPPLP